METARHALIVANDSYADPGLARLTSPIADAAALAEVLSAPEIGAFEVQVSRNEPSHLIQARIEDFFVEAAAGDLLVLYFSGHGVKAETGELYLAAENTRPSRLASSAVPAEFVQHCMKSTRSRSVVLFLDCCYGGAFPQGARVRASGAVDVLASFPSEASRPGGRGRAVITASSAMEYAFEGAQLADSSAQPSVFAGALVHGLRTGEADRDEDGLVSLDELYDYLYDEVRKANPAQTPSRQFDLQGELHIAKSGRRRIRPAALPAELETALGEPSMFARIGALTELRRRLASDDLTIAAAAFGALERVRANDIEQVATLAGQALEGERLVISPPSLRLQPGSPGSTSEQVLQLSGVPLARAVTVRSSPTAVRVVPADDALTVTITWPMGDPAAESAEAPRVIVLDSPMGPVTVPIDLTRPPAPEPPAPEPPAPEPPTEAAIPEPVTTTPGAPVPPGRRRYDRPVVGPLLQVVFSFWIALYELGQSQLWSERGFLVIGVAIFVAAVIEWLVTARQALWTVTIAANGVLVALLAMPMTWTNVATYCLVGAAINAVLLIPAVRSRGRATIAGSGAALILLLVLESAGFLLGAGNAFAQQASNYDLGVALQHVSGYLDLASALLYTWLPLSLVREALARRTSASR